MIAELSIVVPAYNEEEGISATLEDLLVAPALTGIAYEVIVVNDGSTDKTRRILQGFSGIRVVENSTNLGYGAAIKRGVRTAKFENVLTMDSDRSYPASNIAILLSQAGDNDLLIGARKISAIDNPASWNRAKVLCQSLLQKLLKANIPDLNSGMRFFKRQLALDLEDTLSDGFSYSTGFTIAALRRGSAVAFTPIEYLPRLGQSKVRPLNYTLTFARSVFSAT